MESIAGYLKWTIFGSRKSTCSKDVDTNAAAWCACWSLGGSHFDCPRCTRSKTQQMEHAHKPTVENVCTRVLKRHGPYTKSDDCSAVWTQVRRRPDSLKRAKPDAKSDDFGAVCRPGPGGWQGLCVKHAPRVGTKVNRNGERKRSSVISF